MPQFFINRPIFAWVIAVFIILFGLLSIPKLPVALYLGRTANHQH